MQVDDDQTYSDDDESTELLETFGTWERLIDGHYGLWEDETRDCYDMVAGEQWATDDKLAMEDAGKVPVTFNRIAPNLDAVCGVEIENRQKVTYEPRQVGASAQNELLSAAADWVRDECDAEHEESDAFRDALICGVGVIETRMSYDEDLAGQIIIERVDPLEVRFDPSARKTNYADARYIRRKKPYSSIEFEELFPGEDGEGFPEGGKRKPVIVQPKLRYTHGSEQEGDDDTVWVTEWQWFDTTPIYRISHPDTQEERLVDQKTFEQLQELAENEGVTLDYIVQRQRRYRRAFVANGEILDLQDIEVGAFTYTAITGKRDRNKGTFYGLVRPMLDPQRFSNKLFSQILHMVNVNAKGGLMGEVDAFEDIRDAEATWADPAAFTKLAPGGMAKVKEKTPPSYPQSMDRLMEVSVTAIRDTTGINQEMLGLAGRDQPGVLEAQRKKQAYSILSAFFDAARRYRKIQGRILLDFMRKFLPPDTLVRIINDDGSPMYQQIGQAFDAQSDKFNVIVDDTPAGPNQKSIVFQMITQLMPLLQNANLGPDVWAELLKYSPLPSAVSLKIGQALMQQTEQPDPMAEQMKQLQVQGASADVAVKQAQAAHHSAQAQKLTIDAQNAQQTGAMTAQADAMHKVSQAGLADAKAKAAPVQHAAAVFGAQARSLRAETAALQDAADKASGIIDQLDPSKPAPNSY